MNLDSYGKFSVVSSTPAIPNNEANTYSFSNNIVDESSLPMTSAKTPRTTKEAKPVKAPSNKPI
jgi:hypothetical protein